MRRLETALVRQFPLWGGRQATALKEQLAHGWLRPLLWQPTPTGPEGLVVVAPLRAGVELHGAVFEPVGAETLRALLRDLEVERGAPAPIVTDALPGVDLEEQSHVLTPLGYWHRAKVLLRRPASGPLPDRPSDGAIRPMAPHDRAALVRLYASAYAKRPGEFWVAETPDPTIDGREFFDQFASSDPDRFQGDLIAHASFVWEEGSEPLGCIVATAGPIPTVANVMVDPNHQRRGIGERLMVAALHALRATERDVELVAVRDSPPYRLYRRFGFAEVPAPEGRRDGHWVHPTREPNPFGPPGR